MSKTYDKNSIQKMDPLTFCRHRPDTYLGSNENSTQLAREIITNCYDEFLAGHCSEIWVDYNDKENVISIKDNGQGILPNVKKDNGRTILEMVYADINTSGKYDKSDDAVYKVSTGAFGIGASLTNFLSHWLIATTKKNGEFETVYFKEGKFEKRESGKCNKTEHGVEVKFQPSKKFFRDAKPNLNELRNEFFNMTCVCCGLKINFENKLYYHPNGIEDLLDKMTKDNVVLINNSLHFSVEQGRQSLELVMSYTSNSKTIFDCFCNYSIIEAGTPITAVKSCITRVLNKWGKDNKLIKDKNLSGNDLQEGIVCIFNLASPNIRYDSQTKVRVTSTEDNTFINSTLSKELEIWLDSNPEDAKNIINKALVARKAAEAAKKAREAVKAKVTVPKKAKLKFVDLPSKLADCHNKNRQECELFITEGDSASGGAKASRDASYQAIMGLRGKVLNALTATSASIHKNQEIMNIITALGLEWDSTGKKVKYNPANLRYGKLVIAADRDPDGSHIQSLVLTMLWTLVPDLILDGYVYIALPPLYKAEWGKNYQYLADKRELEQFRKNHTNFTLSYYKG